MYKPRFGTRFQRFGAATLVLLSPSPRIKYNMGEREIGWKTVEVIPTCHLVLRCLERLGDLAPKFDVGRPSLLRGVLVEECRRRSPPKFYLDVDGIGRFVLVRRGDAFVGITFLPQIHCHDWTSDSPGPVSGRSSPGPLFGGEVYAA